MEPFLKPLIWAYGKWFQGREILGYVVVFGILTVLFLAAMVPAWLYAIDLYKTDNAAKLSLPEPDVQKAMRRDLKEFHDRILTDVYRDSRAFVYDMYNKKLGDQPDEPKDKDQLIASLSRNYIESDFAQDYTKLTDTIQLGSRASYADVLSSARTFFRSYEKFARWTQQTAVVTALNLSASDTYRRWDKTDQEFLMDFKATTATKGMDAFQGELGDRPFRLRDSQRK